MKSLLARASYAANSIAPGLKNLLPKPLRRWLLLNILNVNKAAATVAGLASRRFMEDDLLPWLRDRYSRILFVGTAPYTYHYEKLFEARGDQFTTMDISPAVAVWGAANHIVGSIQEIGRWRPRGTFDCVVMNGVLGFGVDDTRAMRTTIEAIHDVLKPEGLLVIGWNVGRHDDPNTLGIYDSLFVPYEAMPWRQRMTFEPETHVNDFYIRRPD